MKQVIRKTSKKTSYKYRYTSITTKEKKSASKLKKLLLFIVLKYKQLQTTDIFHFHLKQLKSCIVFLLLLYRKRCIASVDAVTRRKHRFVRFGRTIESFSKDQCWKRFRTRKQDLYLLMRALRLDNVVMVADNGTKFTGEEILLIGLHRYSVPGQLEQSMYDVFHLDFSGLSRAFKLFNNHILLNFSHLLVNNLEYWVDKFPYYAMKVEEKVFEKGGIQFEPNTFCVCAFHDDTVIATTRPGGGPNAAGERNDNFIQLNFYNGWKRHHGYKYQTLELPNGMCADMYGPKPFRCSDLELYVDSHLNARLAALQHGLPRQFKSYGDGIFPIDTHCLSRHVGNTTPEQRHENVTMSEIRISNEWDYGVTATLFPFVKWRAAQKIRGSALVTKYYFVATLLRNAHMCLYEGLAASYFNCDAPDLFDYFQVE